MREFAKEAYNAVEDLDWVGRMCVVAGGVAAITGFIIMPILLVIVWAKHPIFTN